MKDDYTLWYKIKKYIYTFGNVNIFILQCYNQVSQYVKG